MTFQMIAYSGEEVPSRRLAYVHGIRRTLYARRTKQERAYAKEMAKWTNARSVLWFTPQKVVHMMGDQAYVLDFYFKAFRLAVEINGSHHQSELQRGYDEFRSRLLNDRGISVLRFTNDEVDKDVAWCARKTFDWMKKNGKGWKVRELCKHLRKVQMRVAGLPDGPKPSEPYEPKMDYLDKEFVELVRSF